MQYQELMQLLNSRRSIRSFSEEKITEEEINHLIEAANTAPSASNQKNWQFTPMSDNTKIKHLADSVSSSWRKLLDSIDSQAIKESLGQYAHNFSWFENAPCIIVVSSKKPESFLSAILKENALAVQGAFTSAAMATQNLLLAATALRLATCVLTGPLANTQAIRDTANLSPKRELVCLVALGHKNISASETLRITKDE